MTAATDILMRENVRGIRIDALCKKLGVTKGSFYWHFANRAELLSSILATWRRRMTLNIIQNLSRETDGGMARLRRLMKLPRQPRSPQFAQIEQSIRDWGRWEPQAIQAVQEVDQIRLTYFSQLFREMGFAPDIARQRAYLAYAMMMGDSVLRQTTDGIDGDAMIEDVVQLLGQLPDRPHD